MKKVQLFKILSDISKFRCIYIHMLKIALATLITLFSFGASANCQLKIYVLLGIPETATVDISPGLPTEEYTDYNVNYSTAEQMVVATVRCYKDETKPVERIK